MSNNTEKLVKAIHRRTLKKCLLDDLLVCFSFVYAIVWTYL